MLQSIIDLTSELSVVFFGLFFARMNSRKNLCRLLSLGIPISAIYYVLQVFTIKKAKYCMNSFSITITTTISSKLGHHGNNWSHTRLQEFVWFVCSSRHAVRNRFYFTMGTSNSIETQLDWMFFFNYPNTVNNFVLNYSKRPTLA